MPPPNMLAIWNASRERDEALRSLSMRKIKAYMAKYRVPMPSGGIDVIWIMVHKTRIMLKGFTAEEKAVSRTWLVEHGYSTRQIPTHPSKQWRIEWFDLERTAHEPTNPEFPDGIRLDLSEGALFTCCCHLPYPAKRCGQYHIGCMVCGNTTAITTAGRKDDPRSVRFACKVKVDTTDPAEKMMSESKGDH